MSKVTQPVGGRADINQLSCSDLGYFLPPHHHTWGRRDPEAVGPSPALNGLTVWLLEKNGGWKNGVGRSVRTG